MIFGRNTLNKIIDIQKLIRKAGNDAGQWGILRGRMPTLWIQVCQTFQPKRFGLKGRFLNFWHPFNLKENRYWVVDFNLWWTKIYIVQVIRWYFKKNAYIVLEHYKNTVLPQMLSCPCQTIRIIYLTVLTPCRTLHYCS